MINTEQLKNKLETEEHIGVITLFYNQLNDILLELKKLNQK